MPEYVSIGGEWKPAFERVALKNKSDKSYKKCKHCGFLSDEKEENCIKCAKPLAEAELISSGEDFIYEGEDRAAIAVLAEKRVKTLGSKAIESAELKEIARKMGFETTKDYVKAQGVSVEDEVKKNAELLKTKVIKDRKEKKVSAINPVDNKEFLNGQSPIPNGGFGDTPTA